MSGFQLSTWAKAALGSMALDLSEAIPLGLQQAHEISLRAHLTAEMESNDTYGHTLKVKQFKCLEEATKDIDGVEIRRPAGGRFGLIVIPETNVALMPWRYSKNRRDLRERSRLSTPVSDVKQALLGLNTSPVPRQLTLDDLTEDYDLLEQRWEEEREVDEQFSRFGRVVVVGFGSNPNGLWGIGWGDLEIVDVVSGEVRWPVWEALDHSSSAAATNGAASGAANLVSVPETPAAATRFDSGTEEEPFFLTPRAPGDTSPISEPEREMPLASEDKE